jgi:hypothetical protein
MSPQEIEAAIKQRDAMQLVKEIGQWQAVIIGQLEQLVRGGPPEPSAKGLLKPPPNTANVS